jgi:hypothetical protein
MGRTKKKHCADKKKGLFHKKNIESIKKYSKKIVNRKNAPHLAFSMFLIPNPLPKNPIFPTKISKIIEPG